VPRAAVPSSRRLVGSSVGLYGGSGRTTVCDANKLIAFLAQHPDQARAWAGVEAITPSTISGYVRTLTPVLLRTDTLVTNHGFVGGHATAYSAVLEAGTAVLVDQFGVPRVKCSCGNPLGEATLTSSISYTGSRWLTFSPERVVVIGRSTSIIRVFTLLDVSTGRQFSKPAGRATSSPAPTPPSGPAVTGGKARVGQALTVRGFDYHVNSGTWKVTLLKFADPEPASRSAASSLSTGARYVSAILRVENVGARTSANGFPVTAVSSDAAHLVTNRNPIVHVNGTAAGTPPCTDNNRLYQSTPLPPGASATGCYTFELASGEKARSLVVGDGTWTLP